MRRLRGERHMAATEIRSWPARAASSWRAVERMPASQVPMVLGGALAALVGGVALGVAVVAERVLGISWVRALLLIAFGALALIGYKVTRANLRNGAVVAGIAGVALIVVAGGAAGLGAGLLVLVGAAGGVLEVFLGPSPSRFFYPGGVSHWPPGFVRGGGGQGRRTLP